MNITDTQLAQIKRTRILIVDDLPENLQVLGNTLREQGFQIAFATSGEQALSVAAAKLPDLILLDMSMPGMDGLAVCQRLKANPHTKDIPVVFLTARTESESIMRALRAGGSDYVVKPFNTAELISRIIMHLGMDKPGGAKGEEGTKAAISRIAKMLEGEYQEKWKSARSGLFIDDVIGFAMCIQELGRQDNIKLLCDYAQELYNSADQLQIEKMSRLMEQYPLIIKKLVSANY